MNNILNNNHFNLKFIIDNSKYYDFCLYKDDFKNYSTYPNNNDCLISLIDTRDPDCVWFEKLYSKNDFVWEDSINESVCLKNIGFTGVDNGIISFKKDRISNLDFYNLFTNSTLCIDKNDKRLILRKITGNTQLYEYPSCFVIDNNENVLKLNGGFYQGFFKTCDCRYQTLPDEFNDGFSIEIVLKKMDFEKESDKTLNDSHPNNKGIFFYIGTRAENKWWNLYDNSDINYIEQKNDNSFFKDDEYVKDEYNKKNGDNINDEYIKEIEIEKEVYSNDYFTKDYINDKCDESYFADSYINDEYLTNLCNCNLYFKDDYVSNNMNIDSSEELLTNDGYDVGTPNIFKIKTDNKFIFFNRTCTGFTTDNWDENSDVIITGVTRNNKNNFYLLMNRTCTGFTTENIPNNYIEDYTYNILNDLYNNALGFIIKDDGSIGYRYLTEECVDDKKNMLIEEEYSKKNVIKNDDWYTITIKIDSNKKSDKMVILIYVNGKLKLKSKELSKLKMRCLNDLEEKQESVPFNISLGGGTQGLCDMISLNYMELPKYILPLEKYFAGTFIGEIKSFKIFNCLIDYNQIKKNIINDI